jgi:hypothetical protein
MPAELVERLKPAARARTHLCAAAALWTVCGAGLGVAGVHFARSAADPGTALAVIAAGALLGLAKARFALAGFARRNADRILARGDGRCLGGFLSPGTWVFVASMMTAGFVLRRSALPRPLLGLVYVAVGVALLAGSLPLWRRLAGPFPLAPPKR